MRIRQYPVQKKKKNEMEGKERKGGRRKEEIKFELTTV